MAESPLIQWDEPTEADYEEAGAPEAFFPNSCPRMPFETFRVDGYYHYKGPGFIKFKAWLNQDGVKTENPGFSMVLQIQRTEEGDANWSKLLIISALYLRPRVGDIPPRIKWAWCHFDVKTERPEHHMIKTDVLWSVSGEWLQKLCMDFCNPHLYLCKKHPPIPAGKSVLWQKAREHYVLLHKTHAANKRESVGKKMIEDGPLVDRIAHSRRAHYRLLRSPKFRHKQGQRIWVQSAWVGPKEWTDRAGQIYRIVERYTGVAI